MCVCWQDTYIEKLDGFKLSLDNVFIKLGGLKISALRFVDCSSLSLPLLTEFPSFSFPLLKFGDSVCCLVAMYSFSWRE